MLKLKRVEIQGFKSFCDRTEMRFNGAGVAAIVGPNGCGKSNLSDAISWVLGEQSAKSLRGARMEDVIFAGTRERKPLGMAAVTMTLFDPSVDVALPSPELAEPEPTQNSEAVTQAIAGHEAERKEKRREFTVTRRLYRSGESEYLIDGKQARLRDIQDIFMGTGLGPESYAIIEQGRIGQILSSRPQDRRSVIEEAAGITRFKTKRRLAEAKLEGAKQNLTRVFDILEEVTRQVNSLKRQAAKAERYKVLREEMVTHLRLLLAGQYKRLEKEASKAAIEMSQAAAAFESVSTALKANEAEHSALQQTCYQHEEQLTAQRKQLADLQLEAERTRGRLANQSQQVAAIEQRLNNGEQETQDVEARLAAMQAEVEKFRAALEETGAKANEARERLRAKNEEREKTQTELRSGEQKLEAMRQQVIRLLGEASSLRNQLAQIEEFLASNERDRTRAQKESEAAVADLARLAEQKSGLQTKLGDRQLQLESLADQKKRAESELTTHRTTLGESRRLLETVRAELSRLKARKDSLEEILSHRTYTTESVKRLFTAVKKGEMADLKPAGVLADFVEVDAAFEKAAEEFLHEELEYVVVANWAQADRGIDVMRGDFDGRATFLVHPELEDKYASAPPVEPPIGPETGIVGRLSDFVKMTNGLTQAPAEILPRLARCYLVQDRAAAQRLAMQYPDVYFLMPDGVCYHGHAVSGGRKTGSGPLALKRELRELTGTVSAKQKAFEQTQQSIVEIEHTMHALTEGLEQIRQQQQREEKEALALDHEMRRMGEETNRSNARLSSARMELERLGRQLEQSTANKLQKQQLLKERDDARGASERELEGGRGELDALREAVQRVSEEHSVVRVELASLEERQRSDFAAKQRLEAQAGELTRRRANIAAEMERLSLDRTRLLNDNMELDGAAVRLTGTIGKLDAVVTEAAAKDVEMRGRLAAGDEALKAQRVAAQQAQEHRTQIEIHLVQLQSDLKHLDENSRKDLAAPASELIREDDPDLDDLALIDLEGKYTEVRSRIEALGAVNPQALEEYKEAEQRFTFLNTQRQDLLDSIRDTEKAIQDIDVESRKRFAEAFEAINAKFGEMFRILFSGGAAEMRLTDESNIGESGIELIASPPGKRLQNVLLLSGGEKSLTAMALLMAIFKYQPSPFCILDEVDAPLDEANTGRLARLLLEMAAETQFIMITHAKRSMEVAQTLYGVTMEEPGVSKLVSVKFNQQQAQVPPRSPEPRRAAVVS
ncbi:MAG: chromosome segregation protein SMC [Acidobacteria bacterium]|nr:chromosome segregation protein SMC [Acidobacteriota bacterium]